VCGYGFWTAELQAKAGKAEKLQKVRKLIQQKINDSFSSKGKFYYSMRLGSSTSIATWVAENVEQRQILGLRGP